MANSVGLKQVIGPWEDPKVREDILASLKDGFTIVHMGQEKRSQTYVEPNDPDYHRKQYQTNSGEMALVTYLAKMK